jgi:hypothetical protein
MLGNGVRPNGLCHGCAGQAVTATQPTPQRQAGQSKRRSYTKSVLQASRAAPSEPIGPKAGAGDRCVRDEVATERHPVWPGFARNADSALTWLTCGRTFPATRKRRFGVGRIDSARPAAIMLFIYGWRRGPERVSRHVQETMAARGNLAVACEAAGTWAGPSPYARLMTCANT